MNAGVTGGPAGPDPDRAAEEVRSTTLAAAAARWDRSGPVSERRRGLRRLSGAIRGLVAAVMTTTATLEDLDAITTQVEDARRRLAALPSGSPYEGVAEAALAGDPSDHHVIYDHSPILGEASPLAPPLRIAIEGDLVRGEVNFARQYEGPPGCVHGGFVAAAFDEVLGAAQCLSGAAGMTAHLEVDYRAPTPLEADLVFEGWLDRVEGRKVFVGGRCTAGGEMTAEATGLFVTFGVGQFAAMKAERDADR